MNKKYIARFKVQQMYAYFTALSRELKTKTDKKEKTVRPGVREISGQFTFSLHFDRHHHHYHIYLSYDWTRRHKIR